MRGSPPPLWFCPRHWLQTTPKTTATWATSNSFLLPAGPTAFGGRSRRARRSVLCSREGFTDDSSGVKGAKGEPRNPPAALHRQILGHSNYLPRFPDRKSTRLNSSHLG